MQKSSNSDARPTDEASRSIVPGARRLQAFLNRNGKMVRWPSPGRDTEREPGDPVDPGGSTGKITGKAAEIIRWGGVVIYPTDTLYALGASALDREAVRRIELLKGRAGMPISVAFPSIEIAADYVKIPENEAAWNFAREHLPGPYTLILPLGSAVRSPVNGKSSLSGPGSGGAHQTGKNPETENGTGKSAAQARATGRGERRAMMGLDEGLAPEITAGTGNVGVRIPACDIALELLRKVKVPVTATSANLHGMEPVAEIKRLLSVFGNEVDMIIYAGLLQGPASTIMDFTCRSQGIIMHREERQQTG